MSVSSVRKLFSLLLIVLLVLTVQPVQTTLANKLSQTTDFVQYLPIINSQIESLEPNDTQQMAYGPIEAGVNYSSVISTKTDNDFFFFNINTLGNITLDLTTGASPLSQLELTLYDSAGRQVGVTSSQSEVKRIIFTPTTVGRYYVRVCLCSLNLIPPKYYDLKASFNGPINAGDVFGVTYTNGGPMGNVPLQLDRLNYVTQAKTSYYTVSDADGTYHFRGVDTTTGNFTLQVQYRTSLGANYIQLAQSINYANYNAGASLNTGSLDLTPIALTGPANNASVSFPVTFTWTPRASSPGEQYALRLVDPTNASLSYPVTLVPHANGTYTINSLPAGFVLNHPYQWFINGQNPAGEYYFSFPRTITFVP